jgi:hypothetical protein
MPDPYSQSSFALWLDEALSGIVLPMLAIVALAATGGMYLVGVATEGATAAVIIALVSIAAAAAVLRPALTGRPDPVGHGLTLAAAVGTLLLAAVPALATVHPGLPLVEGDLGTRGDALQLPSGIPARARLLVHANLPAAGVPTATFVLAGPNPPVQGHLERTISYARVGRGGRAAVPHDHSSAFLEAHLGDAPAIVLERLGGETAGPLHVAVYRDLLPRAAHVVLALVVLAFAAVGGARLRRGSGAAFAGMALAFGLLVAENATPDAAVGTSLGAVLLGGFAGAVAGAIAAWIARRLVTPAPEVLRGARKR